MMAYHLVDADKECIPQEHEIRSGVCGDAWSCRQRTIRIGTQYSMPRNQDLDRYVQNVEPESPHVSLTPTRTPSINPQPASVKEESLDVSISRISQDVQCIEPESLDRSIPGSVREPESPVTFQEAQPVALLPVTDVKVVPNNWKHQEAQYDTALEEPSLSFPDPCERKPKSPQEDKTAVSRIHSTPTLAYPDTQYTSEESATANAMPLIGVPRVLVTDFKIPVSWNSQLSSQQTLDEVSLPVTQDETTSQAISNTTSQVRGKSASQDGNCASNIGTALELSLRGNLELSLQHYNSNIDQKIEADKVATTKRSQTNHPVPTGGYEHQFVEVPPDMFICKICHHPSREPYLSICCGHTFCKSCLDVGGSYASCPMCRNVPFTTVPNKQNERAIKSLSIFCINREKGCNWQGEVSSVYGHLENSKGCQFEDVICFNQCGATFERWYLLDHIQSCPRRTVSCQYCGVAGEHRLIEGDHQETCPKFPLSCPNSCGVGKIFRENIENHRIICPLEKVPCSQQCGIVLQRKSLASHIENKCPRREVECQYCLTKGEHQLIEGNHQKECPKFPLPCPNACTASSMPRENLKEHREMCPLEIVQCEYYSVGCEAKIIRKNKRMHETEKMEKHLLLTKSKLSNLESTFEVKLKLLEAQLEQKTQLINDMLFKNVFWMKTLSTETLTDVISNKSLPLIFKITDYTKRAKDNIKFTIEHYFKNNNLGLKQARYKQYNDLMYVQLYLFPAGCGDGESSHLSVHFCATNVRSRNPTTLLRGSGQYLKLKLEVLNQVNDSEHQSVSSNIHIGNLITENMKKDWSHDCMISNDALYKTSTSTCQYLRDDCVFFRLEYSLAINSWF